MGFIAPLIQTVGATIGAGVGQATGLAAKVGTAIGGDVGKAFSLVGSASGQGALGLASTAIALANKPKLPPPPQTPSMGSALKQTSLVGPYEGSANGTLVSGTNQRGGGKTLLGQ